MRDTEFPFASVSTVFLDEIDVKHVSFHNKLKLFI